MTVIRRVTSADTGGIAAIVDDVWGQEILTDVCEAQMEDGACALWVAVENDEVAGFVSAFLTVDRYGDRRWEIDLVAVRPASRGQRLGQRLVKRAYQGVRQHDASLARAIVRVENVASQKTFANVSFVTDRRVHKLFLWSPEVGGGLPDYDGRVTLLPVDTLTYRGLWIEGLIGEGVTTEEQRWAVKTARSIAAKEGRLNAGALIPADEEHLLAIDLRNRARMHGEYYWFVK